MKLRVLFLTMMLISILKAEAQQNYSFFKSPQMAPASPEASALFKTSDLPLDYSSGTANLTIPIYTITEGRIKCPITISYNTGGVKVQDVASMIGLGWKLNWGGIIFEKGELYHNESVDESSVKCVADVSANAQTFAWSNLDAIATGNAEKQKPEYYFQFGDYSGSFFFDIYNNVHISSGNHNLKIEKVPGNNALLDGLKITTEDGIEYKFINIEHSLSYGTKMRKTAYLISQITDLNSARAITFVYEDKAQYLDYSSESYSDKRIEANLGNWNMGCQWIPSPEYFNNITTIYSRKISHIYFSGGSIDFNSLEDRLDIDPTRINEITISNGYSSHPKKVKFSQSYFVSPGSNPGVASKFSNRLRLDKVLIESTENTASEVYQFGYNNVSLPHYYNGRNSTAVDYWGYYNGKIYNDGLIPAAISVANNFVSGTYRGDRSVDPAYTQACILNRITYPTGGFMELHYQNNEVPGYMLGDLVGGLRLKSTKTYSLASSVPIEKTYTYSDGVIGINALNNITTNYVYTKVKDFGCGPCIDYVCSECGSQKNLVKVISSSPIGTFNYFNLPVFYKTVEENFFSGNEQLGKSVYTFNNPEYNTDYINIPEYGFQYGVERAWANKSLLKDIKIYKGNNPQNLSLARHEENTYADFGVINPVIGLHAVFKNNYDRSNPSAWCAFESNSQRLIHYEYYDAKGSVGVRLLNSKKVTEIENNQSLISLTNYSYDPVRFQLKTLETTNSKNELLITKYKYCYEPNELSSIFPGEQSVLLGMVAKNFLNNPIEVETYNNSVLLHRVKNLFSQSLLTGYITPQKQYKQLSNNPLTEEISFTRFDGLGNNLEYVDKAGVWKSNLWDYGENFITSTVKGAKHEEIAYSSFETYYTDLKRGNWTFPNSYYNIRSGGITGRNSYLLDGAPLSVDNLNPAKNYVVSYWTKNSAACTITGTLPNYPRTGKTINGWTYFEHLIANQTVISVGGTGYIDELRLYPENAIMGTYTYDPIAGVTSQCDINNFITYYQYDALNRLSIIRDENNNILKKICYNYKGQQENCGVSPTPQWQLTGNLRCVQNGNGQNTGYQEREEKDMNASSATYNTLRWVDNGYNTTACPLPTSCDYYGCTSTMGEQYACIYGQCEQGYRINTDSYYDSSTGMYVCTYHYEFSDGSWSSNYTEYNIGHCPILL